MPRPVATRKRSRIDLQEEEEDQPDELISATPQQERPLSNTKKRKLNTHTSPANTSRISTLGRKVGSAIGGILGWNDRKENVDDDGFDELGEVEKDIYDMESSGDELKTAKITPKNGRARKASDFGSLKKSTPRITKRVAKDDASSPDAAKATTDIWAIPASDDETNLTTTPARKGLASIDRAKGDKKSVVEESESSQKRSRARSKKAAEVEEDLEVLEQAETPSRRKSGSGKKQLKTTRSPSPLAHSTSARKRGRPRKNLDAVLEGAKTPKGILTPSKKDGTLKSRKSVAFDSQKELEGFEDLPKKQTKKTEVAKPAHTESSKDVSCAVCSKLNSGIKNPILLCDGCPYAAHKKCINLEEVPEGDWFCHNCQSETSTEGSDIEQSAPQEEETNEVELECEESEDEEACEQCKGLDSNKGNEIVFCDGCPFAVHRKCYGISALPRGDWYCRNCQTTREELGVKVNGIVEDVPILPDIENFEIHLERTKRILLGKLTGHERIKMQGQDEAMEKVQQVVEQTVLAGEGNSMLVIGARGCGKTNLVESVISTLLVDHWDSFHVVRLNGFIHTDDKLASREIWRQLGREMENEDDSGKTSNYADTLASLLALLSHPETSNTDQTAKSVVFILEEFDLFTTHSRQTLLYNLFDIAQARKAPIVVLGLTTRIDVVESLEKRVKSRFSHRYVHLSLPRSLPAFWDICKQGLLVNDEIESGSKSELEFTAFWNCMIEDLYNKDPAFKQHLQSHFFKTKSVPSFLTSCILPVANLTPQNFPLAGKRFTNTPTLSPPDSKLQILQGLSELELALLIAAARLDIILNTDTCNFAMAYDEYSSLTSRHKIQTSSTGVTALGSSAKVWGREVALGAWERLGAYELLIPAGIGGTGGKDAGAGGRMWKVDVGLEEVVGSVEGLSGVMAKWCREI